MSRAAIASKGHLRRILVPVVFTDTYRRVVRQAAWLARRFGAEMILLHALTPLRYPAGLLESGHQITARDLSARIVQRAQKALDEALPPELDGIAVTSVLLKGDPAQEIVEMARDRNADLIVMATNAAGAFYRFLLGSVTEKVLRKSHCPVWIGTHLEATPARAFSIRHILCSVDLSPHSHHTVLRAAEMAAAADATLTLIHITSSVEFYGPAGFHFDPVWKKATVGFAAREIAKIQQAVGTKAEVVIDSGNVAELLNRVAEQTRADVLVIGNKPQRGHLGDNGNGYGIIRQSRIPILSV